MKAEINGKKRVLYVITQSELGGAQQFLARLISSLNGQSFFSGVVTGAHGSHEIKELFPSSTPYMTARFLKRNPGLVDDIRAIFELRHIIREFRPDILFLNSSKAGFIGALAARFMFMHRPTVIYRIGGWTFNDPWPTWKKTLYRWMEKLSAWMKDYIIVNSQHDFDQAQAYGIAPRKELLLIHNGIDPYLEFLSPEEARVTLLAKISQASPFQAKHVIGSIANFYPTKGLETLIEAMPHVTQDAVCIIIGDGALRPQFEALIKKLGLENRVYLVGKMSNAHQYLPAFDAFVLPSVKEGFPWVLLESLAAKVPVITTRVGAVPDIIESGKNGTIVEPSKPLQLANAINDLLNDDRQRQEYSIEGHQTILHRFNLRIMVERYENLFQSL
jgi:glycosyltransferase involved in cell wall biosynthesis